MEQNNLTEITTNLFVSTEFFAIVIVVGGFILGLIARFIFVRLAERISRGSDGPIKSLEMTLRRAGPLALWTFVFVSVAIAFVELDKKNEFGVLSGLTERIPEILLGAIVVLVGHLLGVAVRDFVRRSISETRLANTVGTIGYTSVLFIGVIVGLQQVEVDISFLGNAIIVVIAILLASVGIAIGIGARFHVANLVASRELQQIAVGDRIQIDGIEGSVVDIKRTRVQVMTESGTAYIPTSRFTEATFVVLSPDS